MSVTANASIDLFVRQKNLTLDYVNAKIVLTETT